MIVVTFQPLRPLFVLELARREERLLIDEGSFTGAWLIVTQVLGKPSRKPVPPLYDSPALTDR
jgi:hypothetical protein